MIHPLLFRHFRNPTIQAVNKLLYKVSDLMPQMKVISEQNLEMTFNDLGLSDGSELFVSDDSLLKPITIRLDLG